MPAKFACDSLRNQRTSCVFIFEGRGLLSVCSNLNLIFIQMDKERQLLNLL